MLIILILHGRYYIIFSIIIDKNIGNYEYYLNGMYIDQWLLIMITVIR